MTDTPTTLNRIWSFVAGTGSIGRYGLIGITGVGLDFLAYYLLVRVGVFPVIATIFSTLIGITNNYIWNSLLNFKTGLSSVRGAKFVTVGLIGLVFSALLLQMFLWSGLDPITAKWLSIPLVVAGQFLANKFWTFDHKYFLLPKSSQSAVK